jgi:hypothetical protein
MRHKSTNILILLVLLAFISNTFALDFKATCTIDRSAVRAMLPYKEVTFTLKVGDAANAGVYVDAQLIASRIDPATKNLIFTTAGTSIEARIYGVSSQVQIGTFKKAVLRDDKLWAWSHGFDDNVYYHEYGTELFNQNGWAGTIFMIGSSIAEDSANWICNAPDIRRLHRQGWAVGNHGYNHSTTGSQSEIVQCQDRIRQVLASTDPNYKPAAFASPAFTHEYDSIVLNMRDNNSNVGIMWTEGQGPSPMRVDSGATEGPWRWVAVFDTNGTVGRTTDIYCYPTPCTISWGSGIDRFMDNVDSIVRFADSTHHYWFNSLDHGVDGTQTDSDPSNDNQGIFSFIPWLYTTHGPGGDNTVWVAPSEKIYSYIFARMKTKLSVTAIAAISPSEVRYAVGDGNRMSGPSITRSIILKNGIEAGTICFDLRGNRIASGKTAGQGLYILKKLVR